MTCLKPGSIDRDEPFAGENDLQRVQPVVFNTVALIVLLPFFLYPKLKVELNNGSLM